MQLKISSTEYNISMQAVKFEQRFLLNIISVCKLLNLSNENALKNIQTVRFTTDNNKSMQILRRPHIIQILSLSNLTSLRFPHYFAFSSLFHLLCWPDFVSVLPPPFDARAS
jgi:hypothetical protein